MPPKHTQRIIVPGGQDRVRVKPIGREQFQRMPPDRLVNIGGQIAVPRHQLEWRDRDYTFGLIREFAELLGLSPPAEISVHIPSQGEPGAQAEPANLERTSDEEAEHIEG